MRLDGRTALVTGAAGHLGRTFVRTLAELGANIVALDLDASRVADVTESAIRDYGVGALGLTVNLENESELSTVASEVGARFGGLNVLVNCAALVGSSGLAGWNEPFEAQSTATWRRALEINLTGPFALVQNCVDLLSSSAGASVINIGSIYGIVGPFMDLYRGLPINNPAAYAASKGGLMQLTRWLATTLASRGIRVNAISLGGIERGQPAVFVERYSAQTPLQRMATEEDLKGALAYLASDLSGYVTGHNLVVDGGWTAW